ncbi:MAG TPA: polyamine ABC transporter ATP-binding protein, partial [Clostridiales bacterium]|nr:polyamine ABC transporter ATP-binding protein [Clostridiales bacterium]
MAVAIHINHVKKQYDDNVVIHDLSTDIKPGELFTLLGPSGCGKTTLLRMIAGFISIEAGTILFDEKVINDVPVHKRNIGMVFQSYA